MSDEHVSNRTLGCNKVCYGSLSCVRIERMLGVLDKVRRQRRLSKSTYLHITGHYHVKQDGS